MKKMDWFVYGLPSLLLVYVLTYAMLSVNGRYVPGAVGTNGVKFYVWEPVGFGDPDGAARAAPHLLFLPLFMADVRWWHTYDKAYDGSYPNPHYESLQQESSGSP